MAENAARVAWSGAGLMLPWRLMGAATLRLTVRRMLGDPGFRAQAGAIGAWAREHDGAARGAELVEELAAESVGASARTLRNSRGRTRTDNLSGNNRLLCQLSYPGSLASRPRPTGLCRLAG